MGGSIDRLAQIRRLISSEDLPMGCLYLFSPLVEPIHIPKTFRELMFHLLHPHPWLTSSRNTIAALCARILVLRRLLQTVVTSFAGNAWINCDDKNQCAPSAPATLNHNIVSIPMTYSWNHSFLICVQNSDVVLSMPVRCAWRS